MEKAVLISEPPSSTSLSSSEHRLICRVCQKQFSQYTCPRCNTRYCSLECYKRHSVRCTESFMRENVMGELRQMQPGDESKKKMIEILKRFHSEEEEEDMNRDVEDDCMLSEEIIQKVLSGGEIKLEDLSPYELQLFQRAVASGELSKMIEPWNPWWKHPSSRTISLSQDGTQLIRPLQGPQESESTFSEIPTGPDSPIPPLSHLISSNPSPLLSLHLIDILYTYCFTLRLYNGDWRSDPLGAATEILTVSSVLGENGQPESVAEALSACLEKTCSPVYRHTGGFKFGIGLIDDVLSLFSLGGNAIICLLCDLQRLIKAGERMLKSEKMKGESRRMLKNAEKKVYFLMSWVHEQPEEVWSSLAGILEVEKASLLNLGEGSMRTGKNEGNNLVQSKVLIEEV